MAYSAIDIANRLLNRASLEAGVAGCELMSHMRLQKMLYYEQGYHLAAFGTPLFEDRVEAWLYGPVVPSVYDVFKRSGRGGLMPLESRPLIQMSEEEENLFENVYRAFEEFSAVGLMNKTHQESPWKDNYQEGKNRVIPVEDIKDYFISVYDA